VTANPEVISSPVGLVPTNALVLTGLASFRAVGNTEVIRGPVSTSVTVQKELWEVTNDGSGWMVGNSEVVIGAICPHPIWPCNQSTCRPDCLRVRVHSKWPKGENLIFGTSANALE
jgi:hypothetical protein